MPRASSILCLPAVLAFAAAAHALELPVIVNGTQVVQAPKSPPATPPAAAKGQLPVIINYPSAANQAPADQKADAKLPVIVGNPVAPEIVNQAPMRNAVSYVVSNYGEYVNPVAYNAYSMNSVVGYSADLGYGTYAPYSAGLGLYSGYGGAYGGYAYPAYDTFGPWGYGAYPPLVEVLDTGVRANVGRLTSLPVRAPVYGHTIGVYYR